LSHK